MIIDDLANPSPRVITIVLNYRHVEDTVRCVRSLQKGFFDDQSVVVVDNASEGSSTRSLRSELGPEVTVLASGGNLGYAGGNNHGIRWARQRAPEFIWIVNPDAVAQSRTLAGLVRAADANPDVGIVGCRVLVGGSVPARIEANGGQLVPERMWQPRNMDAGLFDREVTDYGLRDVDWVPGSCALLRVSMIDDIGLLPEEYFLYFEDTEYCRVAQEAGWRTVVALGTRIWHHRRSVNDLPSSSYIYYLFRNRVHFGVRHFGLSVDDLLEPFDRMVSQWRSRIEGQAPELLENYDSLTRLALEHARAGQFGPSDEVEAAALVPSPSIESQVVLLEARLDAEMTRASRDAARLLQRVKDESSGAATARKRFNDLEAKLKDESRERGRVGRELEALRASRSYRASRAISGVAHPVATVRNRLSRGPRV